MRSFRAKPVGWRGESYRHYLAAKGLKTSTKVKRQFNRGVSHKGVSDILQEVSKRKKNQDIAEEFRQQGLSFEETAEEHLEKAKEYAQDLEPKERKEWIDKIEKEKADLFEGYE